MVALRALLIAIVTMMSLLGPAAAAERAAQRANCQHMVTMAEDAADIDQTWAKEARLLYCQIAATILPECTWVAHHGADVPVFRHTSDIGYSRMVPPGDKPPRAPYVHSDAQGSLQVFDVASYFPNTGFRFPV